MISGLGTLLAVMIAAPAATPTVAARILLERNPDYGPITQADIGKAQRCKDQFLARIRATEMRRSRRNIDLNAPTYEAAVIVAAAIETCLAERAEGLHAIPADIPLRAPLLR